MAPRPQGQCSAQVVPRTLAACRCSLSSPGPLGFLGEAWPTCSSGRCRGPETQECRPWPAGSWRWKEWTFGLRQLRARALALLLGVLCPDLRLLPVRRGSPPCGDEPRVRAGTQQAGLTGARAVRSRAASTDARLGRLAAIGPAVQFLSRVRGRPGVVTTADSQRFYPTLLRPSVSSPCGLSSVLPWGSVPGAGGRSGAPVGPAARWVYRTQGQRITDRICLDCRGPSLGKVCVSVCVCAGGSPLCRPGSNSADLLPTGAYSAPGHGLALARGPVKGLPDAAQNHSTWLGLFSLARHGRTVPAVHALGFPRLRRSPRPLTRHLLQPRCRPATPPEAPCAEALPALGNAPDGGRTLASTAVLRHGLSGTYTVS